jgi:hypothetical protein
MSDVSINFSNEFYVYIYSLLTLLILGFAVLTYGVIKWRKKYIALGIIISLITVIIAVITFYYH